MEKKKLPILSIESLDVEITTKCNLACPYCYIGMEKLKKTPGCINDMSDETIEQVFDLIENFGHPRPAQKDSPNGQKTQVKATHIDFYGGEPLLSWERVYYFMNRSWERGMDLSFSLLTNGTNGTQSQVNWLKHHKVWVQRSIDGHPEAQEKYRPNSIKYYEFQNKIWKDYDQSRRMTIQPEFAKDIMKSMAYFESQGFMEGISPMPNYYGDWTDETIEDFKKSLWNLGKYYLKRWKDGKPFYVMFFDREMKARFGGGRHQLGCGGGMGLHCVSWDGWLYLCHRFSKEPHDSFVCYGSVKDILAGTAKGYGQAIYDQVDKNRTGDQKYWREECRGCIGQAGCMKSCMHTSWFTTHTLDTPPKLWCEIHKETGKIITWLDQELRKSDSNWWQKNRKPVQQKKNCKNCKTGSSGGCGVDMCQEFSDGTRGANQGTGQGCGVDMCQEFSDGRKIRC